MTGPPRPLAPLDAGRLVAPADDPRMAEFRGARDRVNGLGGRMPGFGWAMEGSGAPGTGGAGTKIGGDPRVVANLTVRESVEAPEHFVWSIVRRQFDEALARRAPLRAHGDSDPAFGWAHPEAARPWRARACAMAAE